MSTPIRIHVKKLICNAFRLNYYDSTFILTWVLLFGGWKTDFLHSLPRDRHRHFTWSEQYLAGK